MLRTVNSLATGLINKSCKPSVQACVGMCLFVVCTSACAHTRGVHDNECASHSLSLYIDVCVLRENKVVHTCAERERERDVSKCVEKDVSGCAVSVGVIKGNVWMCNVRMHVCKMSLIYRVYK